MLAQARERPARARPTSWATSPTRWPRGRGTRSSRPWRSTTSTTPASATCSPACARPCAGRRVRQRRAGRRGESVARRGPRAAPRAHRPGPGRHGGRVGGSRAAHEPRPVRDGRGPARVAAIGGLHRCWVFVARRAFAVLVARAAGLNAITEGKRAGGGAAARGRRLPRPAGDRVSICCASGSTSRHLRPGRAPARRRASPASPAGARRSGTSASRAPAPAGWPCGASGAGHGRPALRGRRRR